MFEKLKRLLGAADERVSDDALSHQTMTGETLDQEIDAIRQTMVVDPSRLRGGDSDESDADDRFGKQGSSQPGGSKTRASSRSKATPKRTPLYRPVLRPPMAFLSALDDGSIKESEVYRLRGGVVVIGREQGDVTFPHEVLMSSKHAQLECRRHRGGYQWHFVDLDSRNGSFFRVQQAYLRNTQEFLIGGHRFAFRMPTPDGRFEDATGTQVPPNPNDARATQLVADVKVSLPKLVYRDPKGPEQTFTLESTHIVIGSDPATSALSISDPYVCPNHLQLHHTPRGWLIEDLSSRNGVWLRLHDVKLDQITEFQLGEQRFYFRPPAARKI
ncbi:FHA domain-containing protein [Aporhodopirellula aestuarii]|uniref:FHA domain-containing protein n=1 Tax=Aporhodopirellula aestuarii TaxID=2950107 RepID=A0ABT0UBG1_9BACT|nr:FHA domain-containing protein [Aporhodopirellula aestuarii]MCM2373840.1 FHA domain-containing protein [Aporhodopirellula aestuarii]